MRVYLLGAGASFPYSLSPTGVNPPLAANFFDTYDKLQLSYHVKVGHVINYVNDKKQSGNWNNSTANIEDFLTEIDDGIAEASLAIQQNGPNDVQTFSKLMSLSLVYDQMVFLFATVLNEIQNGPASPEYSLLVNQLSPDDVLLTFNWDTLLDRVLWDTKRWFPDDGYGLNFASLFENDWRSPNLTSCHFSGKKAANFSEMVA